MEQTDSNGYIYSPPLECAVFSDLQISSKCTSLLDIGNFASTSNILCFNQKNPMNQHTNLGDIAKDFAQCLGARGDVYFRQFGFLPLIQYQFHSYSGEGHLQNTDMVEWITTAHGAVSESRQFNY